MTNTGSNPFSFDFATIGGSSEAATLSFDPVSGNLEITSAGVVVASQPLSGTSAITIAGEGDDSLTIDFTNPFAELVSFQAKRRGQHVDADGRQHPRRLRADGRPDKRRHDAGRQFDRQHDLVPGCLVTGGHGPDLVPVNHSRQGANNVTISGPSAGVSEISGTSAGTAFAPVSFSNVAGVTVDTGSNDVGTYDDTVIIQSGGLAATGLQSFAVDSTGAGNNMLLDYNDSYDLPVSGGTFSYSGGRGNNTLVGPNSTIVGTTTVALVNVAKNIPVPVIVIPGLGASFATPPYTSDWVSNIGLPPSELALDPIQNTYADLVQSLENTGYVLGQSLFEAPWDWRLPIAPQDGTIDGMLSNLTASELTGGTYHYAVDYLGTALVQAATAWAQEFNGRPLPAVDVITHSTGAVLARAYVQSHSYGQTLPSGVTLPKINDAVVIAPANQGDPETWDYLNNNFSESTFTQGLSLFIGASYAAVVAGGTITSPNGNITLSSITVDGEPSIQQFLLLYMPSLVDLLPTFPFLDPGSGTLTVGTSTLFNNLLFDLNDGYGLTAADLPAGLNPDIIPSNPDPSTFLDDPSNEILGKLDVIYSSTESTAYEDVQEPAGTGSIVPLGSIFSETPTQTWYMQVDGTANGDGTLSKTSTIGQFENSPLLGSKVLIQQILPAAPEARSSTTRSRPMRPRRRRRWATSARPTAPRSFRRDSRRSSPGTCWKTCSRFCRTRCSVTTGSRSMRRTCRSLTRRRAISSHSLAARALRSPRSARSTST